MITRAASLLVAIGVAVGAAIAVSAECYANEAVVSPFAETPVGLEELSKERALGHVGDSGKPPETSTDLAVILWDEWKPNGSVPASQPQPGSSAVSIAGSR